MPLIMIPRRQNEENGGAGATAAAPKVLGFVLLSIMIVSFTCLGTGCVFVVYLRRRHRRGNTTTTTNTNTNTNTNTDMNGMEAEGASERSRGVKASPRKLTKPQMLRVQSSLRRISLGSMFEAGRGSGSWEGGSRDLERRGSLTKVMSLVVDKMKGEEELVSSRSVRESTGQMPQMESRLDARTGQQPGQQQQQPGLEPARAVSWIPPVPPLPAAWAETTSTSPTTSPTTTTTTTTTPTPTMTTVTPTPTNVQRRSRHRRTPAQDQISFLNGPAMRNMPPMPNPKPMPISPALHLRSPLGSIDSLLAAATKELALPGGTASPSRARAQAHHWQQQQQQTIHELDACSTALMPPPRHPGRLVPQLPRLQIPGSTFSQASPPPRLLPPTPPSARSSGHFARPISGHGLGLGPPVPRHGPVHVVSQLSPALNAQLSSAAAQRRANPGNDSSSLSTLWSVEEPEERTPEKRRSILVAGGIAAIQAELEACPMPQEPASTSGVIEQGGTDDSVEKVSPAYSSPVSACSLGFSIPPPVSPGSLESIAVVWQSAMGDISESTSPSTTPSDFGSTVAEPGVDIEPTREQLDNDKDAPKAGKPFIPPEVPVLPPSPSAPSSGALPTVVEPSPSPSTSPSRSRSRSPSPTPTSRKSSATISAHRLPSNGSSYFSSVYSTDTCAPTYTYNRGSQATAGRQPSPSRYLGPSVCEVIAQLRRMNDSTYSIASLASTVTPSTEMARLEVRKVRERPASERSVLPKSESLYDMDGFLVEEKLEDGLEVGAVVEED